MEFPNPPTMTTNSSLMVECESDEMLGSSTTSFSSSNDGNHNNNNNNNNNTNVHNQLYANSLVGMYHRVVEKYQTMPMHWTPEQDDENDFSIPPTVTEPQQQPIQQPIQSTTACSTSACVTRSSTEQGGVPLSSWEEENGFQEFSPDATCAGVVGGMVGLLLGGIAPSFLCAMGCMVAAKDDDGQMGHWARQCGRIARQTAVTAPKNAIMERLGFSSTNMMMNGTDSRDRQRWQETKQFIGSAEMERDSTGTIWINVQPTQVAYSDQEERLPIPLQSETDETNKSSSTFPKQPLFKPALSASDVGTAAWCMPCDASQSPANTNEKNPISSPQTPSSSFTASPLMDQFPRWCIPVGTEPLSNPDLWTTEELFDVSSPLDSSMEKKNVSVSSSSNSSKYNNMMKHTMLPLVTKHSLVASSRRNLANP